MSVNYISLGSHNSAIYWPADVPNFYFHLKRKSFSLKLAIGVTFSLFTHQQCDGAVHCLYLTASNILHVPTHDLATVTANPGAPLLTFCQEVQLDSSLISSLFLESHGHFFNEPESNHFSLHIIFINTKKKLYLIRYKITDSKEQVCVIKQRPGNITVTSDNTRLMHNSLFSG